MATRELNAISLYTGVGGLDLGFEAAGFRTASAVEVNPVACRTIRRNRPDWNLIERDIHDISSEEILDVTGLQPRRGRCPHRWPAMPTVLKIVLLDEWGCAEA